MAKTWVYFLQLLFGEGAWGAESGKKNGGKKAGLAFMKLKIDNEKEILTIDKDPLKAETSLSGRVWSLVRLPTISCTLNTLVLLISFFG